MILAITPSGPFGVYKAPKFPPSLFFLTTSSSYLQHSYVISTHLSSEHKHHLSQGRVPYVMSHQAFFDNVGAWWALLSFCAFLITYEIWFDRRQYASLVQAVWKIHESQKRTHAILVQDIGEIIAEVRSLRLQQASGPRMSLAEFQARSLEISNTAAAENRRLIEELLQRRSDQLACLKSMMDEDRRLINELAQRPPHRPHFSLLE